MTDKTYRLDASYRFSCKEVLNAVLVVSCIGCEMPVMLEQPALYVPRAGGQAIECDLCESCVTRIRFGDRALRELVELRLLLSATPG